MPTAVNALQANKKLQPRAAGAVAPVGCRLTPPPVPAGVNAPPPTGVRPSASVQPSGGVLRSPVTTPLSRHRHQVVGPGRAATRIVVGQPHRGVLQAYLGDLPTWNRRLVSGVAGIVAGTGAFFLGRDPDRDLWDRLMAALATGVVVGTAIDQALALPSKGYARRFSANIRSRRKFHADIDRRLNLRSSFDQEELTVSSKSLEDAAGRLRDREEDQKRYVSRALKARGGIGDIFDTRINNSAQKNSLWKRWVGNLAEASVRYHRPDFETRVATSLARIIAQDQGYSLLTDVWSRTENPEIQVRFEEQARDAPFNLGVTLLTEMERDINSDNESRPLTTLKVEVPATGKYDDAQSFKRAYYLDEGGYDASKVGNRLTAAPIDVDFFHEFVHARHLLALRDEERIEKYENLYDRYHREIGGKNAVLVGQDRVSEFTTIHRASDRKIIRSLLNQEREQRTDEPGIFSNYCETIRDLDRIEQIVEGIPSENDFRIAVGLAPRQDHRAVRLEHGEFVHSGWRAPIIIRYG